MNQPNSSRSESGTAMLVAGAFIALHLLLLSFSFDAIDLEELEYGNFGIALLDQVEQSWQSFQTYPREGSRVLLTPLVAPLFAIFGSSLWTLKLAGILGASLWAGVWFLIARRLVPSSSLIAAFLLFALPMPLVQRAAISASSSFAHLGASAWHGLALLLLLPLQPTRRLALSRLVLSGLSAGLGLFCGFALAPLLPGLAWFITIKYGWRPLLYWGLATLPGLGWAFHARDATRLSSQGDLIVGLTGLESGGAFRGEVLSQAIDNLWLTVVYGAGFGRVDEASLELHYLPLGAVWSLLLVSGLLLAWKAAASNSIKDPSQAQLARRSLLLSMLVYLLVLLLTGFKVEIHYFDGPRYLLPMAPLALIAALWAHTRLPLQRRRILLTALLFSHVLGFALLCRPAVFPAPWTSIKGYEPWVRRQFIDTDLQPQHIESQRLPRWTLWAGLSAAFEAPGERSWPELQKLPQRHGLLQDDEAREEFWRGFGVGVLLATEHSPPERFIPADTPPAVESLLWQGLAMGYNNTGCQEQILTRLFKAAEDHWQDELWYGAGRADIYCKRYLQGLPDSADKQAFSKGRRDGWRLDYWSGDGELQVSEAFLNRLYIY
tara:strand:+ start:2370 stop:4184 length:1815 start_codon:yes stop_codon:yes gene_type:complete